MLPVGSRVNFKNKKAVWRFFYKTPEFLIRIRPSLKTRFAVTVSIKVSKKSSRRNLLKRRTKGVILRHLGIFKNAPVKEYWISLLPPANNLTNKEFEIKLNEILFK
ncbi:MAG: ribonuclease P protein component [Candidatus Brennerbacteria bacterium]|nr:ribonuclease P protein component [Candidatus Brennerbacteria bacterium]